MGLATSAGQYTMYIYTAMHLPTPPTRRHTSLLRVRALSRTDLFLSGMFSDIFTANLASSMHVGLNVAYPRRQTQEFCLPPRHTHPPAPSLPLSLHEPVARKRFCRSDASGNKARDGEATLAVCSGQSRPSKWFVRRSFAAVPTTMARLEEGRSCRALSSRRRVRQHTAHAPRLASRGINQLDQSTSSRGINQLEAVVITALRADASFDSGCVAPTPHAHVCARGPPALVGQNLERLYLAGREHAGVGRVMSQTADM